MDHSQPVGIICVVGILGVLGALISLRDRQACALTLMVLGYATPYAIAFAHFYRYRYPIEPLLAVLAALAILQLSVWSWQASRRALAKQSAA